jgi:TPR repeat protein
MSADLGYARASFSYGGCLSRGEGIEQDLISAARYYKISADLGASDGMLE